MTVRQRRSTLMQFAIIGALLPLAFICLAIIKGGTATDFSTMWVAGKMALNGDAPGAYDPIASAFAAQSLLGIQAIKFPYPPLALLLFAPLAVLPHVPALIAWNVATAALFVVAARPFLPKGFPALLAVVTPAALLNLLFGQTGLVFGALWLFAFNGSWISVALLAFKPHLGVLALFTLRTRRSFKLASAALIGLVLLSILAFGLESWRAFIEQAIRHSSELGTGIGEVAQRNRWLFVGASPAIAYGFLGWIPFAVAAALIVAKNFNVFTAATAAVLISPYGFHYDLTVVTLGCAIAIFTRWDEIPTWRRIAFSLGFLSPLLPMIGAWWVPPALLYVLWTQATLPQSVVGLGSRTHDGDGEAVAPTSSARHPAPVSHVHPRR